MKKIILFVAAVLLFVGCSDSSSDSSSEPCSTECGAGDGSIGAPYVLCTAEELTRLAEHLDSNYILGSDINLSAPWSPIGTRAAPFTGSVNGRGYTISGLTISGDNDYAGLFGYINQGVVSNLSIQLAPTGLSGNNYVGGLSGRMDNTTVTACFVDGHITGKNYIGGVVGYAAASVIEQAGTDGNIVASGVVGGIAGAATNGSQIADSYSLIEVSSRNYSGGIVGLARNSAISRCMAIGAVENLDSASIKMGGIVGSATESVIHGNMALNSRIEGQRQVGRIAGEAVACTEGLNYGIDMAIWGIQEGSISGATLTPAEAATMAPYEEMGWLFGGDINAPWSMASAYPVINYW